MQADFNTVITLLTIVFSAGMVYNKLNNLEKKVNAMNGYGEMLAKHEAEINNLKTRK